MNEIFLSLLHHLAKKWDHQVVQENERNRQLLTIKDDLEEINRTITGQLTSDEQRSNI